MTKYPPPKRYSSSQVRERFADMLDAAERGEDVVIERRGVRFALRVEPGTSRQSRRRSIIEYMDPAVERGEWSWTLGPDGLAFRGRRSRK